MDKQDFRLLLEALEMQRMLLASIRDLLEETRWTCGCGWINGAGQLACAKCGRTPGKDQG